MIRDGMIRLRYHRKVGQLAADAGDARSEVKAWARRWSSPVGKAYCERRAPWENEWTRQGGTAHRSADDVNRLGRMMRTLGAVIMALALAIQAYTARESMHRRDEWHRFSARVGGAVVAGELIGLPLYLLGPWAAAVGVGAGAATGIAITPRLFPPPRARAMHHTTVGRNLPAYAVD